MKFLLVLVMALLLAQDLQDDTKYRAWLKEQLGLERPEVTSPSTYWWKEPSQAVPSTPAVEIPGEAAVDGRGGQVDSESWAMVVGVVVVGLAVIGGLATAVLFAYQSNLFGRYWSQGY